MMELENNAEDYIIITDGNYISTNDFIIKLSNEYVISGIKDFKIDNHDVKEYRLSSEISTKYVYSFKNREHTYNMGISLGNILFLGC